MPKVIEAAPPYAADLERFADKTIGFGFVVIKRLDADDEMAAPGIVKPEIARQRSQKGLVVAAAHEMIVGSLILPMQIKTGDIALFTKHGGTDFDLDGQKYVLVHHLQVYFWETPLVGNS